MDPRKQLSKTEFVGALAATVIIFLIGMLFGGYTSDLKLSKVTDLQDDLRIETMALELQSIIASESICDTNPDALEKELQDVGSKLEYMENQLGFDNKNVRRLKEYYSLLEIRHWLLNTQRLERCSGKKTIVLYFYSNDVKKCSTCKEQGFVLDYLKKKYDTNLSIYSFDIDAQNSAVQTLRSRFRITEIPGIVIGSQTYVGFKDRFELEPLLGQGEE